MYVGQERRLLPVYFKALANPTRLRILERLAEQGEVSVNELARYLRMSQPRVSWHLTMLRRGGAVKQRKEGRQVHCSLDLEQIRRRQLAFWQMLTEKKRIGGIP
jgi:ArsR family transcriptional regulator